jgi:gibberellin 20-oxidase
LANKEIDRKTLAFFLCPKGDKIVRAPDTILGRQESRNYPDFTWSQFFEFTQRKHRADFASWLNSNTFNYFGTFFLCWIKLHLDICCYNIF